MSKDVEKRLPQLYYIKTKISYDLGVIAILIIIHYYSVLIIHWHRFQVSYTRAHLAKRKNLHQKVPSVKSPGYAN